MQDGVNERSRWHLKVYDNYEFRMKMQAHGMETATVPPHGSIPPNNLVANLACDHTALRFPTTPTPIPDVPTEYFPLIANVFTRILYRVLQGLVLSLLAVMESQIENEPRQSHL
jgi:hypothetical protein